MLLPEIPDGRVAREVPIYFTCVRQDAVPCWAYLSVPAALGDPVGFRNEGHKVLLVGSRLGSCHRGIHEASTLASITTTDLVLSC